MKRETVYQYLASILAEQGLEIRHSDAGSLYIATGDAAEAK